MWEFANDGRHNNWGSSISGFENIQCVCILLKIHSVCLKFWLLAFVSFQIIFLWFCFLNSCFIVGHIHILHIEQSFNFMIVKYFLYFFKPESMEVFFFVSVRINISNIAPRFVLIISEIFTSSTLDSLLYFQ